MVLRAITAAARSSMVRLLRRALLSIEGKMKAALVWWTLARTMMESWIFGTRPIGLHGKWALSFAAMTPTQKDFARK